jgi:hypothetical protein
MGKSREVAPPGTPLRSSQQLDDVLEWLDTAAEQVEQLHLDLESGIAQIHADLADIHKSLEHQNRLMTVVLVIATLFFCSQILDIILQVF